ncbi:MAG: hypothetical protein Q4C12_03005 [Clostridia bacterium]|nr:hypothetical protein [Clostridia bacterium]
MKKDVDLIDALIEKTFLAPFRRDTRHVGTEHEFPLINKAKCRVDIDVARGVFDIFLKRGFHEELFDEQGRVCFAVNGAGDCISYDNSYNNFEIALNHGESLTELAERFYSYAQIAQEYFLSHNHTLTGMGTNPYMKYAQPLPVEFSTYNMVREYLTRFRGEHGMCDFPAYLSSVQTHLDVNLRDLARAYSFFAKTDFVRALLFANSNDFDNGRFLCYRDYLWEKSAFGMCPSITGVVDDELESEQDIIELFKKKGMFNRIRNGKYEVFKPQILSEYFKTAPAADIECYLSFCNVEITRRGTLEIRSDCEQPMSETFAPSAFNKGLLANMEKAASRLAKEDIPLPNSAMRALAVQGKCPIEYERLRSLLTDLVQIAGEGLTRCKKGEEKFLEPVFSRAERMTNPAKEARQMGVEAAIEKYSRFY